MFISLTLKERYDYDNPKHRVEVEVRVDQTTQSILFYVLPVFYSTHAVHAYRLLVLLLPRLNCTSVPVPTTMMLTISYDNFDKLGDGKDRFADLWSVVQLGEVD